MYHTSKRILDLLVATLASVLLLPVILLVALLVYINLGSPVLFKQQRIGQHSRPFMLYKFRSMKNAFTADGKALPDKDRLTRFGVWLRATSLDELPALWLVLKGTMSLVGPRPLLPEYLPYYTDEQNRRHSVKPGFTGWAQVNGRNAQSWEERFAYDLWYVDHASLQLDLTILLKTLLVVIKKDGIHAEGHVTMPNFAEYMEQKRSL